MIICICVCMDMHITCRWIGTTIPFQAPIRRATSRAPRRLTKRETRSRATDETVRTREMTTWKFCSFEQHEQHETPQKWAWRFQWLTVLFIFGVSRSLKGCERPQVVDLTGLQAPFRQTIFQLVNSHWAQMTTLGQLGTWHLNHLKARTTHMYIPSN